MSGGSEALPAPKVPNVACGAMAAISLAVAGALFLAIAESGFPDGHLTAYQRWALPLQKAAAGALVGLGLGFAGLALVTLEAPARSRLFRAALVAALIVTSGALALPWIGQDLLHLEDGQGG